jgi:nickel-dependent lactate racemase
MTTIGFPYADVPPLMLEEGRILGTYATKRCEAPPELGAQLRAALAAPIGTPPLRDLARGCRKVLLVADDISRPTPARHLLPGVLEELEGAGVPRDGIEIMMALGTHRFMTAEEIERKVGADVFSRYRCHNHDWKDPDACAFMGKTEQGVEVWINKKIAQADLVIGIGRIMPIDVCGFTGGGKILIPGVCGKITNDDMHWTRIDLSDEDILGRRDNPVRASIDALARQAGLDFIVNVVMDIEQRVAHVVAGDLVEAHREGCRFALDYHAVRIPEPADIVIADSYPFDIEFWQANKALDQAGQVVRAGGVLILVTPCPEGFSVTHPEILDFGYRTLPEIKELVRDRKVPHKVVGVHMAQVSRVAREKAHVILVSSGISETDARKVGLDWAATPQEALRKADARLGGNARIAVLRGAAEMLPLIARREPGL